MKKILIGLVALVFIIGGSAFAWYKINYGGTNYYVQIHNDGKKLEEKTQSGSVWHGYGYKEKAYNNAGQEKTLDFTATHNLRHEAYLVIAVFLTSSQFVTPFCLL